MKVYMVQLQVQAGKPEENFEVVKAAVERGKAAGADVVLLPECSIAGSCMLGSLGDEIEFLERCAACRDKVKELSREVDILLGGSDTLTGGGQYFQKGEAVRWGHDFEVLSGYATDQRRPKSYSYYVTPKGMQFLARHHKIMIKYTEEYEGRE